MRTRLNRTNIKKLEPKASSYYVSDTDFPAFRVRVTPGGAKTFYLLYRNAKHRQITFKIGLFGEITPEQARDIAEKKMAGVKLGGDPAAEKQEQKRQAERDQYMTLQGFLDNQYGPWIQVNRKTGGEILKRIKGRFAGLMDKRIDELTPWHVEKWRKNRFKEGRKVGTVNRDIGALKSCLARAVDWGLLDQHPLTRVKLSKEDRQGVVRYLSPEEEQQLREALYTRDERLKQARRNGNAWREERGYKLYSEITGPYGDHLTPMVILSLNTGMRRTEVFHMRWADIDFNNQTLVIHGYTAKSGRTLHIPLNIEALEALKSWRRQQDGRPALVFPARNSEPFNNVKKAWEGVLSDAGIIRFRWHDMRHHFASRLVMAGVDLNTVRELMGHADIRMTLRYAHLAPEHKAAAVAKLVGGA